MTTITAYDSLNLFDKLAFAIRSIVMRSQTAQPRDNRSWVYQRAQERFEYLVEGGDLINLAPVPAGQPLVNVLPEHRDQLLALGVCMASSLRRLFVRIAVTRTVVKKAGLAGSRPPAPQSRAGP